MKIYLLISQPLVSNNESVLKHRLTTCADIQLLTRGRLSIKSLLIMFKYFDS